MFFFVSFFFFFFFFFVFFCFCFFFFFVVVVVVFFFFFCFFFFFFLLLFTACAFLYLLGTMESISESRMQICYQYKRILFHCVLVGFISGHSMGLALVFVVFCVVLRLPAKPNKIQHTQQRYIKRNRTPTNLFVFCCV